MVTTDPTNQCPCCGQVTYTSTGCPTGKGVQRCTCSFGACPLQPNFGPIGPPWPPYGAGMYETYQAMPPVPIDGMTRVQITIQQGGVSAGIAKLNDGQQT